MTKTRDMTLRARVLLRRELAQDVLKDPAVLVVLDLLWGIETRLHVEGLAGVGGDRKGLPWGQALGDAGDGEGLFAGEPKRLTAN